MLPYVTPVQEAFFAAALIVQVDPAGTNDELLDELLKLTSDVSDVNELGVESDDNEDDSELGVESDVDDVDVD